MSEWKTYKLCEVANLSTGFPFDGHKYAKEGQRVVRGDNVTIGELRWDTDKDKRWNEPFARAEEFSLQEGDIVIGMDGSRVGRNRAQIKADDLPLLLAQRVACVRHNEKSLQKFLYYQIFSKNFENYIKSVHTGTSIPHVSLKQIGDFSFQVPDLSTQQRIAGILGSLDDKIELNRRINANLEAQAQALFRSWFVDNETQNNNPGFFNDIIQTTLSGDWGQETPKGNYISEVYCIRGADIPDIKCGDKGKLPTRYILEKNLKNKKLSENDLVVEISGGSPTQSTGRICLITRALLDRLGKDVICTNFCRALKPIPDYSFFIYLYWQYLYNNNTMFSYENGTTGIKNLNITDFINKEPITIPGKKKILEFNKVLQPIFDMIYKNGRESEYLSALRDTLLPKLMAGEIKIKKSY